MLSAPWPPAVLPVPLSWALVTLFSSVSSGSPSLVWLIAGTGVGAGASSPIAPALAIVNGLKTG
ncbi:hypothetical protein PC121_g21369 [Phytophthora cactorum]|nr:hypothetical protein PC120_g23736 [Phytophthora cactorum]KAG3045288.1 hypothetical protein PC121_g21369 [Phytophthora cactorum]KAG4040216.1 hypothetical protein PC123_g24243 [Phytophthora cactorum]